MWLLWKCNFLGAWVIFGFAFDPTIQPHKIVMINELYSCNHIGLSLWLYGCNRIGLLLCISTSFQVLSAPESWSKHFFAVFLYGNLKSPMATVPDYLYANKRLGLIIFTTHILGSGSIVFES